MENKVFEDLKRRVNITRRVRIKSADRLRKKHDFFEKTTHGYSILLLVASIFFLGVEESNYQITKVLLVGSLILTFATMYLNIKNYKERANNFETNYQQLDTLWNKISRIEMQYTDSAVPYEKIKELHREYEKMILDKENHTDIDYQEFVYQKGKDECLKLAAKNKIKKEKTKSFIINSCVRWLPLIAFGIYIFNYYY